MTANQTWHVALDENTVEELTSAELLSRIGRGELPRDVLVWRAGMSEWATAASLRGTDLPPDFAVAPAEKVISRSHQVESTAPILTEPPITEEPKAHELFIVPQPKPTGSFFAQHWRGKLSLGVSYWVCGTVFTFLFEVFDRAYLSLIDVTSTPKLWAGSVWGIVLASVVLGVWQLVGIMRSASRTAREHSAKRESAGWARIAQVMVLLGALALVGRVVERAPLLGDAYGVILGVSAPQAHSLRVVNHGREVLVTGGIDFGTADDFAKLLDAAHEVKVVDLDSIGGRIAEAEKIGRLVKEHSLATYTNARCVSACTLVFLAGAQRYAGTMAKIGFHSYSAPGLLEEERSALERDSKASLTALGVPAQFVDKVFATPNKEMWYPTNAELTSANIVTQFVSPYDFSLLALGAAVTEPDADKFLSAISSLAALKQVDAIAYGQLVKNLVDAAQRGDSAGEITLAANGVVQAHAQKNKLHADDQTLVAFAGYMGALANLLADKNPQVCMKVLMQGATPLDYVTYETPELQQQDTDLTAKLILAGSDGGPRTMPSKDEANKSIETIWRFVAAAGLRIDAVGKEVRTPQEDADACRAFGAFFTRLGGMPPTTGGPIVRYLFSNAS